MDTNKILSASLLDIVFDNRNKSYGAYELRNTYAVRMSKAIGTTSIILAVVIASSFMGGGKKNGGRVIDRIDSGIVITTYTAPLDPVQPKPEVKPAAAAPEPAGREVSFSEPVIVVDEQLKNRIATIDELKDASPGTKFVDGPPSTGIVKPATLPGPGTGTDPAPATVSDEPIHNAPVPSKFIGDWVKFLLKNLNPEIPVDNNAPPGRYTIIIQFVVDREGKVSDVKPLTNVGFGMEEEAVRVLKRATKWEPAQQNGTPVKAYHKQPITFEVPEE